MFIGHFDSSDYRSLLPDNFVSVIEYVKKQHLSQVEPGKYRIPGIAEEDAFYVIMDYETVEASPVGAEFHRHYCDVQFLVHGQERFGWTELSDQRRDQLEQEFNYDEERDICFFDPNLVSLSYQPMTPGEFYLFSPGTAHMPNLCMDGIRVEVRKVVIKIKYPHY